MKKKKKNVQNSPSNLSLCIKFTWQKNKKNLCLHKTCAIEHKWKKRKTWTVGWLIGHIEDVITWYSLENGHKFESWIDKQTCALNNAIATLHSKELDGWCFSWTNSLLLTY